LLQPRPHINTLIYCIHGGIDYHEIESAGISPEAILDFSTNCNPFGPPPGLWEAISNACVDGYPDSASTGLKRALSSKLDITTENLLVGSGSTELIRLVALAYFNTGDKVLIPQPVYGEYEIACQLSGAQVITQYNPERTNFHMNVTETIDLIQRQQPKGLFLCNPNNPTGQYLSGKEVEQIVSTAARSLIILDEAYIAFTNNSWPSYYLINRGNVVILRSMTKDYALAGLRLGYAIADSSIISVLKRVQPPWSVTSISQNAGIHALKADTYLKECEVKIREAKIYLIKALSDLGLTPLPSETNFFMVKVGNAAELRKVLLKKGILVRDCTSFGLPDYIRLAPRTIPECTKLVSAIKEVRTSHAG
jgi:histidinol-phosphate aminotransferase